MIFDNWMNFYRNHLNLTVMDFYLSCYSPSGNSAQQADCLVISQNSNVAVVAPRLLQPNGRRFKAIHHLEVCNPNALSPEYYDLSRIETVDTLRVSAKVRAWLTTSDAKRLEFFFRSMLAPRILAEQTNFCGLIATYKFDESTNENTFIKTRPVFIVKSWENGRALVLAITSSDSENNYRQLLNVGQIGNLEKRSSIALDHWYTVDIKELTFRPNAQLPLLATLLTQARCQRNWTISA